MKLDKTSMKSSLDKVQKTVMFFLLFIIVIISVLNDIFNISFKNVYTFLGIHNIVQFKIDVIIFLMVILILNVLDLDLFKIESKLSNLDKTLNEIKLFSKTKSVFIDPSKYPFIWENFIGHYYAINSPWLLEEHSSESYRNMINKHVKRYKNENLIKTYYVFFTKTQFKGSLQRFKKFMYEVKSEISALIDDKVRVVIIDDYAPNYVLFIGEKYLDIELKDKSRANYSILYINETPFMTRSGLPNWCTVTVDSPINNVMLNECRSLIFDENKKRLKFNGSEELSVNEFLEHFDQINSYFS